jgi:hypothetical protein
MMSVLRREGIRSIEDMQYKSCGHGLRRTHVRVKSSYLYSLYIVSKGQFYCAQAHVQFTSTSMSFSSLACVGISL